MVLTPTAIGEFMSAVTLRLALVASGAVLAGAGLLAAGPGTGTQTGISADSIAVPLAPTTSVAPWSGAKLESIASTALVPEPASVTAQ